MMAPPTTSSLSASPKIAPVTSLPITDNYINRNTAPILPDGHSEALSSSRVQCLFFRRRFHFLFLSSRCKNCRRPRSEHEDWSRVATEGKIFKTLHDAAENGSLLGVKYHLQKGRIDRRGKGDCSILHISGEKGFFDIAKFALEARANVEARDAGRFTPLHWAAAFGHLNIVTLLLDHGAVPSAKDTDDQTPLELAIDKRQIHVVKFFASRALVPPKIAGVVGGMLSATQDDWQPPSEAVFNIVLENSSGGEIGITLTDSGQGESDFLGQYRAEVRKVLAGSPGDKAGLQVGDVVLEVDGETMCELAPADVYRLIRSRANALLQVYRATALASDAQTSSEQREILTATVMSMLDVSPDKARQILEAANWNVDSVAAGESGAMDKTVPHPPKPRRFSGAGVGLFDSPEKGDDGESHTSPSAGVAFGKYKKTAQDVESAAANPTQSSEGPGLANKDISIPTAPANTGFAFDSLDISGSTAEETPSLLQDRRSKHARPPRKQVENGLSGLTEKPITAAGGGGHMDSIWDDCEEVNALQKIVAGSGTSEKALKKNVVEAFGPPQSLKSDRPSPPQPASRPAIAPADSVLIESNADDIFGTGDLKPCASMRAEPVALPQPLDPPTSSHGSSKTDDPNLGEDNEDFGTDTDGSREGENRAVDFEEVEISMEDVRGEAARGEAEVEENSSTFEMSSSTDSNADGCEIVCRPEEHISDSDSDSVASIGDLKTDKGAEFGGAASGSTNAPSDVQMRNILGVMDDPTETSTNS